MLRLENVSTEYDRVPMLREIKMGIEKEGFVCLLGSNGAGKTTTVRTIIGLVKPVKGEIYFQGSPIGRMKTNKIVEMGIAVVPEGRRLFPKMTVYENLRLGAFFVRDKKELDRRVEKVFSLFPQLEPRLSQLAGTLSGGEQSMVTIGRGLMGNPKMMLLDEPSLGLAPKLVNEYFSAISHINREQKITMLLIEQNATKALSISDYGYILQKGRILAEGSARDLMDSDIVKEAYLSSEG